MALAQSKRIGRDIGPDRPEVHPRRHWPAAIKSGLTAGVLLMIMPMGIPWASMAFFSGAVMGRLPVGAQPGPGVGLMALHLALALLYAIVIGTAIRRLQSWRAIFCGGLVGLGLYGLNWLVARAMAPHWVGQEAPVIFAHVIFGLVAAAAYRGLRMQGSPRGAARTP